VDPVWLLKALGVLLFAALLCGYGTLCLLLYQGQWQLILHPKQTTAHPAEIGTTPVEFLHFGPDESATPQRTGWFIPAAAGASYTSVTVLFLPSGDGSLVNSLSTIEMLHDIGVNVFGIDYRGYGQSAAVHPNEQRMVEDADSAWDLLTTSRAVPEAQIVPYGVGLGTSLAVHLAMEHPTVGAVILDDPAPDPLSTVRSDPRTSLLPVRLLLRDRFPLVDPLSTLKTPKLLLSSGGSTAAFGNAASPKLAVTLPEPRSASLYAQAISRFLDQYRPGGDQRLRPAPTSPGIDKEAH
jgi:pimeloyl-ACP methyl ester carboxylesterase